MTGPDDLLIANGVDAITGDHLLAPQSIRDVALAARRPEPDRTPTAPLRTPVEVVTYVTDDPAGVAHDEATGRITGARSYLPSYVDLDGTARHVGPGRAPSAPGPSSSALIRPACSSTLSPSSRVRRSRSAASRRRWSG